MTDSEERAALIAGEVRAWLARRQKNQADLASHLGIARSAVTRRMKGERLFSVIELMEIADWLGISLADLLGPEILRARKSPRGDLVTTGAGELPRLDSNQQPFD
ncbi:helix-turn-helix domain-containing protein [Kocuria palustris]|uniref:helix-turn-helix domain-containing protein n=1 Tax=Kocuria palustris TaxID=71999 RepID=UPI0035D57179